MLLLLVCHHQLLCVICVKVRSLPKRKLKDYTASMEGTQPSWLPRMLPKWACLVLPCCRPWEGRHHPLQRAGWSCQGSQTFQASSSSSAPQLVSPEKTAILLARCPWGPGTSHHPASPSPNRCLAAETRGVPREELLRFPRSVGHPVPKCSVD